MPVGLVELVLRRPAAVLATAVLAVLGLVAGFTALPHGLPASGFEVDGSESQAAENSLVRSLGHEPEPKLLILARGEDLSPRVYNVALRTVRSELLANPEVATVEQQRSTKHERMTLLEVFYRDLDVDERQHTSDDIAEELDPGPLTIEIGGQEQALLEARDEARDDAVAYALPALLIGGLLLVLAVGWRLALIGTLCAALGSLGALAIAEVVNQAIDVSIVSVPPALVIAIVLALEGTVLQCVQCRWELAAGSSPAGSVRRAVLATRRPIILATLAATAVLGAVALLPLGYGRSIDVTAGAAALLTGVAVLLVVPAGLSSFGWSLVRPRRRHGGWVGRWPWLAVPAGIIAALAIGLPSLDARTAAFDTTYLPDSAESARTERAIDGDFGPGRAAPAVLAVPSGSLGSYTRELERLPGVVAVSVERERGLQTRLVSAYLGDPAGSRAAMDTVRGIRALRTPHPVGVGGVTARALDGPDRTLDRLPLAGGIALGLVVVLLVVGAWSWRGAALALLAPLAAVAAAGVAIFVFSDGRLTGMLDYRSREGVDLAVLVCACSVLFAIAAARSALAAGRPKQPAAGPRFPAAPAALVSTAAIAAGAAGLLASDLLTVKEFGLTLGAGVVLDLVLVRLLAEGGIMRREG